MKDSKGHGSNSRGAHATGTDAVGKPPVYHVTATANVPNIQQGGIKMNQPSVWEAAARPGKNYGKGQVYAFENEADARRWAARTDFDFNKQTGSGKVSIVKLDPSKNDWKEDTNDPLSHLGSKGRWLKSKTAVPASSVLGSEPFTREMAKALVQGS
jgi:hypothetical protein